MSNMQIGFIGLGRMGENMVSRMLKSQKINVIVWNRNQDKVQQVVKLGATGASTVEDLVSKLTTSPKIVWSMLPSGKVTEDMFQNLLGLLSPNDIIIEGANSNYKDTIRRHQQAAEKNIKMLDVGVSGGIVAAKSGYPMMVGGDLEIFSYLSPIFKSFGLAEGYDLVGGPGSGHYVKMIHNAIEYGMMQAISEGFDLLKNGSLKDLDLKKISHIWNHGSIVSSFLMQMVENALNKDSDLKEIKPFVDDSGEGRWSVEEALKNSVPFVANSYALQARYQSRDQDSYTFKLLSAMRNEFGGHPLKK